MSHHVNGTSGPPLRSMTNPSARMPKIAGHIQSNHRGLGFAPHSYQRRFFVAPPTLHWPVISFFGGLGTPHDTGAPAPRASSRRRPSAHLALRERPRQNAIAPMQKAAM